MGGGGLERADMGATSVLDGGDGRFGTSLGGSGAGVLGPKLRFTMGIERMSGVALRGATEALEGSFSRMILASSALIWFADLRNSTFALVCAST